jgi:PAS domain S-box-containing protein
MFESAKDAILILDDDSGAVIDVNPRFIELSRYPRRELIGRAFWEIPPFLDVQEGRRLVPEARQRPMVRYEPVLLRARDGRRLFVDLLANRYEVKDRSLIQINIRDITDRKEAEEKLRRMNQDLQQFAYAASHDLQEPLRTVTTHIALFERKYRGALDEDAERIIGFITTATDHMRHLVLDLLAYAQVVQGRMEFESVSMEAVLSSALRNLQTVVHDAKARVTFDLLPELRVAPTQMTQLLQNLIGNAIKYRGGRPPQIHISARKEAGEWIFSVADNGEGIEAKYLEDIFTVFRRLHGSELPGTGIGLAICKRIVERHAGRIWAESTPGEGSTFYFAIPEEAPPPA